jgi:hypothetical protein
MLRCSILALRSPERLNLLDIYGSSVWNLLFVTLLVPKIFRCLLNFGKFMVLCVKANWPQFTSWTRIGEYRYRSSHS